MKKKKFLFNELSLPKIYDLYDKYKFYEEPYEEQIFKSLPDDPDQLLAIVRSAGAAIAAIEDDALMTSNYFIFSQLTYIHARFKMSLKSFKPDSFLLECILNHPILFNEYFKLLVSSGEAKEPVPDPPIEMEYSLTPIGTEILNLLKEIDELTTRRFEEFSDNIPTDIGVLPSTNCNEEVTQCDSGFNSDCGLADINDETTMQFNIDDDVNLTHNNHELTKVASTIMEDSPVAEGVEDNVSPIVEDPPVAVGVKVSGHNDHQAHYSPTKISRTYADVLRHHEKDDSNNIRKSPCQASTPLSDVGRQATKAPFDKEYYRKRNKKSVYKRIVKRVTDEDGFISFKTYYIKRYGPTPYRSRLGR